MATRRSPEEQAKAEAQAASLDMLKSKGFVEIEQPEKPASTQEPIDPMEDYEEVVRPQVNAIDDTPAIETAIESAKAAPVEVAPVEVKQEVKPEVTFGSNYYPIDMDSLPSRGHFYNGKQIYLRNFKVLEVKKLAAITQANAEDAVNKVLRDCIKGVDFEDILSYDKIALMFFIRVNTFPDPRYKIGYTCNNPVKVLDDEGEVVIDEKTEEPKTKECKSDGDLHFTASDLKVKKLPDDFTTEDMLFVVNDTDSIEWGFPSVKDELEMEKQVKEALKELKDAEVDKDDIDKEMLQLAYLIKSINGKPSTLLEKYLYITDDKMTPQDSIKFLSEINSRFDIGIDTEIKDTCKECGGKISVSVMFSPEFFFPRFKA